MVDSTHRRRAAPATRRPKAAGRSVRSRPKVSPAAAGTHQKAAHRSLVRTARLENVRTFEVTALGASRASNRPATPEGTGRRLGPLRTSPARADHAVLPGAAARRHVLRAAEIAAGAEPTASPST